MSRDVIPFSVADISAFAKTLRGQLPSETAPTHAQMLGMVAKAAGYQNYQHLRAKITGEVDVNQKQVKEALRVFDAFGRMHHWPKKYSIQGLSLWVFWGRLPSRRDLTEPEVNEVLKASNTFGDHVLIRRSLIDHGLVTRTIDGKVYRRIEREPTPEARVVLRQLRWRG